MNESGMWINCCGSQKGGIELGEDLEGVLGIEAELSDLGWKIFSGDPRLVEIWLPFNAYPHVGWGRVVSAMVVFSPVRHLWNQKRILMQDKYLVYLATSCWFHASIHVHVIHLWFGKILWILTWELSHFFGFEYRWFQFVEKDSPRP